MMTQASCQAAVFSFQKSAPILLPKLTQICLESLYVTFVQLLPPTLEAEPPVRRVLEDYRRSFLLSVQFIGFT